jgi:hypothetical protein
MNSDIIIYQTEDGQTKIETHFDKETAWLTQAQISALFQKERSVITKHINNVFTEGELKAESNVQNLHIAGRMPMYMKDWLERLDGFLTMTGNEILTHTGTISHDVAIEKAHKEYALYKQRLKNELSRVEQDFLKQIEQTEKQIKKGS